jgi:hypothetical protein
MSNFKVLDHGDSFSLNQNTKQGNEPYTESISFSLFDNYLTDNGAEDPKTQENRLTFEDMEVLISFRNQINKALKAANME